MPSQLGPNDPLLAREHDPPATSLHDMAVKAVYAYPLAAIFLAFGVGYLVMRLLR